MTGRKTKTTVPGAPVHARGTKDAKSGTKKAMAGMTALGDMRKAPAVMQPFAAYQVDATATARGPRSHAMAAIHSAAADLHEAGAIDRLTMRHFDRACLSEYAIGPDDVRAIRQANHVSQTVFARYLGTSASTVKQWESGAKEPSGMARTLLNAVRKHGLEVLS